MVSLKAQFWVHYCFYFTVFILQFLLYINDLPNVSSKMKFFLFADDTNIYFESDDLLTVEKIVNKELWKLYLWLIVNRLPLNVSKTNYIIFHPNKPLLRLKLIIKLLTKKIILSTMVGEYFEICCSYG